VRAEHALSERQARPYVNAAQAAPDGVAVPERTAVFTANTCLCTCGVLGGADADRHRSRSHEDRAIGPGRFRPIGASPLKLLRGRRGTPRLGRRTVRNQRREPCR
jgi:hypothetical protein